MQLKADVQRKLYLAGLILVANILLVIVARLTGCAPTSTPAVEPVTCGELKLGQRKVEACQGGAKVTVCTDKGAVTEADTCGLQGQGCVSYEEARPVLSTFCVSCHRGELDSLSGAQRLSQEAARRVFATDSSRMPPSGGLAEDAKATLKAFADQGAKESCGQAPTGRKTAFDLPYVENAIVQDLLKADEDDRPNFRYLVTAHKTNQGEDPVELEKMVNKAINSISLERQLYKAVAVDPARVVFRIDLDELQINAQEWQLFQQADKAKVVSQTTSADLAKTLIGLKDNDAVWFHADNFTEIVNTAQVYNALLDVQGTFLQEVAALGVDYQNDLKNGDALMGCITESSISASRGNRMLSVHSSKELSGDVGGMYVTYDPRAFNGDNFRNCFKNPFLFETKVGNKNFNFDAGEWIALLPNGMLRYGLNAEQEVVQQGKIVNRFLNLRQNAAPTDIVADGVSPVGIGPEIKTPRSCHLCHQGGIIPFKDEVSLKIADSNSGFNAQELDALEDRYRGQVEMDEAIDRTNDIFHSSLRQLGINPAERDPINFFANKFLLPWDLEQLCNFVLLPDLNQCRRAIARSDAADEAFGQILAGGKVTQEIILQDLQKFIDEAGLLED